MSKFAKMPETYSKEPSKLLVYRWGGAFGPFKVNIPCGECTLTSDIIETTLEDELSGTHVEVEYKDWLTHLPEAMLKGARHAPAVLLNGKVISQGEAINRGALAAAVMVDHVDRFPIEGNHVFGKKKCGFCTKAKELLDAQGIEYTYHDVVENPAALYEMITRAKQNVGGKTPITTPQIWIDGKYVGGYDQLAKTLDDVDVETV